MVEQWTHKPLDVGSNPTLATFDLNPKNKKGLLKKTSTSQIPPAPILSTKQGNVEYEPPADDCASTAHQTCYLAENIQQQYA